MEESWEEYIEDSLEQIRKETHENNVILRQIVKVINTYILRYRHENEDDFGRNVLANLLSSQLDINKLFKKR